MKTEILAPAGDIQSALAAIHAGADAIYLGMSAFSARANAGNFDSDALSRILTYAHLTGVKVYVCLNTLVKDGETEAFFENALIAWNKGADALLIQDIFLGKELKRRYPDIVLHLSTQAGCCNVWGARLAKEYGFSRAVLARETPLADIRMIAGEIETEVFVQGALCSCFSGQCYLSSFAGNQSGNRGRCKQPCRKRYSIDRKGYEENAYALSLSDLCVGEQVFELLQAGVVSLKIEGRMRRPEYVAAAVRYYRAVLAQSGTGKALSDLKRAYNRGDYTEGLAFEQNQLLSRNVQGHIGEKMGTIAIKGGKYFCKGVARTGDGFKILRAGKEVGGAVCCKTEKNGFYLSSDRTLRAGDEVRMTTDTSFVFGAEKLRPITLSLRFAAGECPKIRCGGLTFTGDTPLEEAKRAPLTQEELETCFRKTDGAPFFVQFESVFTEGAFLPKSALNALRRAFFEQLIKALLPERRQLAPVKEEVRLPLVRGDKTAVISEQYIAQADVFIHKPQDYKNIVPPPHKSELYLYLPPLLTAEDEQYIGRAVEQYDGIYGEGTYAVLLAQKYGKKLFAGTGFNLTNRYAVVGVKEAGATYFALSKELTAAEQRALCTEGAFALTLGDIKVMDLGYCPFERTCADCDQRECYRLTDEDGRVFPLRRYRTAAAWCKFEVYNCAPLAAYNGQSNAIVDLSVQKNPSLVQSAFRPEGVINGSTSGHKNRSLL